MRRTRNPVYGSPVSRVRIPPFPPYHERPQPRAFPDVASLRTRRGSDNAGPVMDATQRQPVHDRQARQQVGRLVQAFFDAVSFAPDRAPRYEALHELFVAQGLLVNNAGDAPEVMPVAAFVRSRQASYDGGGVTRFEVVELADTTELFGNVAHRASAFVRRGLRDGQPFELRGMIFLQCLHTPQGWKLASVAWDDQRPGQGLAGHAEPTEFG